MGLALRGDRPADHGRADRGRDYHDRPASLGVTLPAVTAELELRAELRRLHDLEAGQTVLPVLRRQWDRVAATGLALVLAEDT